MNKKITVFDIVNYAFLAFFCLTILYPFWNLLMTSLNNPTAGSLGGLSLWAKEFTLDNYKYVLSSKYIWIGYRETLFRTVLGTSLTIICTASAAYALSKKYFPSRNFWTVIVLIPMFFSGGMIPNYLLIVKLGLIDSRFSLILPSMISVYNLIIMRNFMMSLPAELEESARIDGASEFKVFWKIVLPMSKAVLATIALWTIIGHWNAWFDAFLYIQDTEKMPLQVVLRRILLEGTDQMINMNPNTASSSLGNVTPEVIKAATVFICVLPILCIYPYIQKYFVKGTMVGSLKG